MDVHHLIREQLMDEIDDTINIDTYETDPYQYILKLIIEVAVDYIQKERLNSEKFQMGTLELEYKCIKEFLEIEDDKLAEQWIKDNRELTDKGLIGYVIDNVHRMPIGKHKFILCMLKTYFNCRF